MFTTNFCYVPNSCETIVPFSVFTNSISVKKMLRKPLCHFQCSQIYALKQMPRNHCAIFSFHQFVLQQMLIKTLCHFFISPISAMLHLLIIINILMVLFSRFPHYCSRKCICNHFLPFPIPSYLPVVCSARQYLNDSGYSHFEMSPQPFYIQPANTQQLKLKCRKYPAIHTNYNCSNCTISN